jgi:hypothetical protein
VSGPGAASAADVPIATSLLGSFRVALALEEISCLAGWDDLRPDEGACLDLGALLGAPARPPNGRRVAGLGGAGRELFVLLGEAVSVRPVGLWHLYPLPPLLAQAGARFGCAGLVRSDEGFYFLLDAERLRGVARGT